MQYRPILGEFVVVDMENMRLYPLLPNDIVSY
jgi:hypothetical protein